METRFIRTHDRECPYCKTKHPVELMIREAMTHIKGRAVRYAEMFYWCDEVGDEFETNDMYLDNMDRAYEAYGRLIKKCDNTLVVRIGNDT
jgi:hypothetical protein